MPSLLRTTASPFARVPDAIIWRVELVEVLLPPPELELFTTTSGLDVSLTIILVAETELPAMTTGTPGTFNISIIGSKLKPPVGLA